MRDELSRCVSNLMFRSEHRQIKVSMNMPKYVAPAAVYEFADRIREEMKNSNKSWKVVARVRRQNIRHNSRRRLVECGPRLGVDIRRRVCGVASADIRWSVA